MRSRREIRGFSLGFALSRCVSVPDSCASLLLDWCLGVPDMWRLRVDPADTYRHVRSVSSTLRVNYTCFHAAIGPEGMA
ncbi:hypothetical protein DFH06DRAFT_1190439 [Mycena polygramma]|nr:hypothetical protein DFH06DRAFT_1190439 [Mycena polygramma]